MSATITAPTDSERPDAAEHATARPAARSLRWMLLLGAVARLALWWYFADQPVVIEDAKDYNRLAIGIVEQGAYVSQSGERISLRPPFYPAVVAAIYKVFGVENYAAVRLVQAVLSLVTSLLAYRLGVELYSHRVGWWTAAAVCFYPPFLGFANLLLSEVLFTFFVTAVALAAVLAIRQQSFGWLAATGLLLGFGALTRSILYLAAPFLAFYLLLIWDGGVIRRLAAAAVPLVLTALVLFPWAYRNTRLHRTLTIVDCMGGRNLMMGNYEYTPLERSWATIDIAQGEQSWHRVLATKMLAEGPLTQGQIDKRAMAYGKQFILSHPGLTLKRNLVKFFNYWQLERSLVAGAVSGLFGPIPKVVIAVAAVAICGSEALAMLLGIFGAVMVPPRDRRAHWLLLAMILFPCAVHTLIFAHSRYHLPQMPLVLLYAVAAAVEWRMLWQRRRQWSFRIAALMCLILIGGWVREIVMVDLARLTDRIG